jgi:hypothetical protein
MYTIRHALLLPLFLLVTAAHADETVFPTGPINLKAAESQGLHRLSAEELKALLPGTLDTSGPTDTLTRIFNPDGSFVRKGSTERDLTGKWRIDETNNAYCTDIYLKKGRQNYCFAVFRATDGTYYFDYDLQSGFYTHVWRRVSSQ